MFVMRDSFEIMQHAVEGASSMLSSLTSLVLLAFTLYVWWKIFEKAGIRGWKACIPGYNFWMMHELVWGKGYYMFFNFIPIYGIIFSCKHNIRLAHAFGRSTGFGVGCFLLNPVFQAILAFSDSQYEGVQGW